MILKSKKIWLIATIICSACLLILAGVLIYSWLRPGQEFVVWPKDEVQKLKAQNSEAIKNAGKIPARDIRPFDNSDYFQGKETAKVRLIVYTDFDCPFCAGYNKTLDQVAKEFKNDVVIVYRNFPLDAHSNALGAANAWLCSAEQGKWQEAKDLLYDMNNKSEEKYLAMADMLKLNKNKFADCLKTEKYNDKILADKEEAKSAGVTGTPTAFLNDIILPGAYQFEDFVGPSGTTKKGLKSLITQQLQK